jgi:hypothetical protein
LHNNTTLQILSPSFSYQLIGDLARHSRQVYY